VDQLKRGTRGQEKTSQASDHVFISMWEVATHDWSSCESGVRTLQKGEKHGPENDTDVLPTETVAHIQSAVCKAQKKSVIGALNRCWKYLIGAISTHGEATRDLEFIGRDKDKQLEKRGQKQGVETFSRGMKLRTRRKGFLRATRLIDKSRSRKMTK
jgi:hypothetical protein